MEFSVFLECFLFKSSNKNIPTLIGSRIFKFGFHIPVYTIQSIGFKFK